MGKVGDDAESASSDENVGSEERLEVQIHSLVFNIRAVGIRGAVTGRDEKEREQLVLQEGSEALEMQAVTLGLGWTSSGAD